MTAKVAPVTRAAPPPHVVCLSATRAAGVERLASDTLDALLARVEQEQLDLGDAALALMVAAAGWSTTFMRCRFSQGIPSEAVEAVVRDFRLTLLANLSEARALPPALAAEYREAVALDARQRIHEVKA